MSCIDCYYFESSVCQYCNYNRRDYIKPDMIFIDFPSDPDLPF